MNDHTRRLALLQNWKNSPERRLQQLPDLFYISLSSSSCPFLLPFPHVHSLSSLSLSFLLSVSLILPFYISGHFSFLLSFHPPSFCLSNRPPSGLLSLHSSLSFPVYSLSSSSSLPCSKPQIRRGQNYFSLATSETGATREG